MNFNGVFEYQPIPSELLTKPSRYKRAENNLLADGKIPTTGASLLFGLYIYTHTCTVIIRAGTRVVD